MGILSALFGQSVSKVTVQPSGVAFEVKRHQSILEAALAEGIAFPHSCTVGTCGSCKCLLKSGKIREITNFAYVLSAEELRDNVVLACQAGAKTDVVLEVPGLEAKRLNPAGDFIGRITALQDLTHDIKRVTLTLDRPLRFDAGQYVQLAVDAVFGARAYSLAMAPAAAGNSTIELFVRRVPEGEFTELLFAGHLADMPIKIHGPAGNFWLRDSRAPMICIAGGSGLAPLLAMLESATAREVGRNCVLLFGARTQADLYARDAIDAIAARWNGAFSFVPVLSDAAADAAWQGARGLVTEHIASAAQSLIAADTEAYLCGPPPMIDAALPLLSALGIAADHVHFDKFLDGRHGLARQDLA
ncbi:MAG: 2Fe-2S iron-sulfur cluster binding domain-containing protein [Proteobacteria bacterium]|nr:2Fe-2S iron-sulfur cluster binding domain-containing protein [Pseudomonadota bacterium]